MGMIGYFFRTDDETLETIHNGATAEIVFQEDMKDCLLDIDKTWHAIHFILTGCKYDGAEGNILNQLIFGETPVNDDDLGYGPAMVNKKDTVIQIAAALNGWDKETFRAKFHIHDMIENEIYPVMDDEAEEEFFTYVWEYFVILKEFYQQAASEGQHVLTFIC